MEKAFEKLLRKLLLEKYPIYLDVHVSKSGKYTPNKRICYEVFLIIFDEYYGKMKMEVFKERCRNILLDQN